MAKNLKMQATYPYALELVWQALTTKEALSEWLMDTDFELVKGHKFRFHDKPQGGWRGYMECQVLDFQVNQYLEISWLGMPEHDLQTVRFELTGDTKQTTLTLHHFPWNSTHGAFGGFILKKIIQFGWKRMFFKQLPIILQYVRENSMATVPIGLVNQYRQQ
ncbi:MAG: SRPBCC domain-containing protein [Spirochaetota bacterium]